MYDGQKIIEIRNGSGTMVQQFIHGTQYIDELVMVRVKDKGDLYVHQDANWNVIGTTDLGRHLVERDVYSPYGELTVHQSTGFGDRDGDGEVDATDKGTVGVTCTTMNNECRILDLDFDGDYDSTDASAFDNLPQGLQRTPGRLASAVQQPFAHQGLLFEPEIGSYQNRAREYDPVKRLFVQRDPFHLSALKYLDSGGLNSYAYVHCSPLTNLDPSGQITLIGNRCGRIRCYCPNGWSPSSTDVNLYKDAGGNIGFYNGVLNIMRIDAPSCCAMASDTFIVPNSHGQSLNTVLKHECVHACQRQRDGFLVFNLVNLNAWLHCPHPPDPGFWTCNPYEIEASSHNAGWSWLQRPRNCVTAM